MTSALHNKAQEEESTVPYAVRVQLVGRFGLVAAKKRKEGFFFKKRMSEN
jgi:hypothetical protein